MNSAGQTSPVLTPGTGGLCFSTPSTLAVTCLGQLHVRRERASLAEALKASLQFVTLLFLCCGDKVMLRVVAALSAQVPV